MIEFKVAGPFALPIYKKKRVIHIDDKRFFDFWEECEAESGIDIASRSGCYIFGLRRRNIIPYYVGKTWKGFQNEVFKPYQLTRYNKVINDHGTPVLFFVYKELRNAESKRSQSIIMEVEKFLIQTSVKINDDLLNVHGTKAADWNISGVLRSRGTRSVEVRKFKSMLDFS